MTLPELQAKELELMQSLGLISTSDANGSVGFSSDTEKLKALAAVRAQMAALSAPTRGRVRKGFHSRGW